MITLLFLDYIQNLIRVNINSEALSLMSYRSLLNLRNPQIQPSKHLYICFYFFNLQWSYVLISIKGVYQYYKNIFNIHGLPNIIAYPRAEDPDCLSNILRTH